MMTDSAYAVSIRVPRSSTFEVIRAFAQLGLARKAGVGVDCSSCSRGALADERIVIERGLIFSGKRRKKAGGKGRYRSDYFQLR